MTGRGAGRAARRSRRCSSVVLFAWPVVAIVGTGLRIGGTWQLDHAVDTLTSESTRGVLGFTLWQAALSTVASFVLGLPAGLDPRPDRHSRAGPRCGSR